MKKLSEELILEYKYDTEDQRTRHVASMESKGFYCTGQLKKSDNDVIIKDEEKEYYWYAKFILKFNY